MLRRFLAAAPALLVLAYGLTIGPKYDRYVLPAFDGYVYDAMADTPRVFTLAPWGYRILAPWIVHFLPFPSAAEGFFWLNLGCLSGAVFILGFWLRRLGFGALPAALAGTALLLSRPMRELLHYQVLVDPLALFMVSVIFLELTNPRVLILSALFAAGALSKEVCLLPLFMVPVMLVRKSGWKRGLLGTAWVAGPALALALYLRFSWGEAEPVLDAPLLEIALGRLRQSVDLLPGTASLSGVGLLALIGLAREGSVPLRVQGFLMWLLTFAAAFLNPYHFSIPDLHRLSVFAWPALLPLALAGIGFRRANEPAPAARFSRLATTGAVATLLICVCAVLASDSFRHEPEDAWANPISYLARNREAIKTARLLDEGGRFEFDSQSGRFAGPVAQRFNLTEGRRQRWFLFEGFGRDAVFESGSPEFRGGAQLLLPVLTPRAVTLSMEFEGPKDAEVTVTVAGQDIASIPVGATAVPFLAPARWLARGDNILRLREPSGRAIRLIRFEARIEAAKSRPR